MSLLLLAYLLFILSDSVASFFASLAIPAVRSGRRRAPRARIRITVIKSAEISILN